VVSLLLWVLSLAFFWWPVVKLVVPFNGDRFGVNAPSALFMSPQLVALSDGRDGGGLKSACRDEAAAAAAAAAARGALGSDAGTLLLALLLLRGLRLWPRLLGVERGALWLSGASFSTALVFTHSPPLPWLPVVPLLLLLPALPRLPPTGLPFGLCDCCFAEDDLFFLVALLLLVVVERSG
jgi:hypothetical protein